MNTTQIRARLAESIYEKRATEGWSLRAAAKAIGISDSMLYDLENETRDTTVPKYVAICRWLEVDPGEMLR